MKAIYLDNASTTPLKPEVLTAMEPYLTGIYGNANSTHFLGREAMAGLDRARETVAGLLNAEFNEIYFTSGGTESNNFAIRGAFEGSGERKGLVTTSIEHPSVLETAKALEKRGAETVFIKPNQSGVVSVESFTETLLKNAFLTSVMSVNNELGTIQPVSEICKKAHEHGSLFFTDCVQGYALENLNVKALGVDMLSLSAHKFGGPKGVGVLYIKNGVKLETQLTGGHQERSRRSGTSNVAGAVGLSAALSITRKNLEKTANHVKSLRDTFIEKALKLGGVTVNGSLETRIYSNANLLFSGVRGETILNRLDMRGICASIGSACTAGTLEPSHVLTEIGLTRTEALSSIRFTFSESNTEEEVDFVIETLKSVLENLRQ